MQKTGEYISAAPVRETTLSPYVTLRPVQYTADMLQIWTRWCNANDIRQWMTASFPKSEKDVQTWLFNATHDDHRHYFTIIADSKTVGLISLRQDQQPDTSGEIGIIIGDPQYRNRGVGTQAISYILDFASGIGINEVRAHIKPDNTTSIRLFSNQGFTKTCTITLEGEQFDRYEKKLHTV